MNNFRFTLLIVCMPGFIVKSKHVQTKVILSSFRSQIIRNFTQILTVCSVYNIILKI